MLGVRVPPGAPVEPALESSGVPPPIAAAVADVPMSEMLGWFSVRVKDGLSITVPTPAPTPKWRLPRTPRVLVSSPMVVPPGPCRVTSLAEPGPCGGLRLVVGLLPLAPARCPPPTVRGGYSSVRPFRFLAVPEGPPRWTRPIVKLSSCPPPQGPMPLLCPFGVFLGHPGYLALA